MDVIIAHTPIPLSLAVLVAKRIISGSVISLSLSSTHFSFAFASFFSVRRAENRFLWLMNQFLWLMNRFLWLMNIPIRIRVSQLPIKVIQHLRRYHKKKSIWTVLSWQQISKLQVQFYSQSRKTFQTYYIYLPMNDVIRSKSS